MNREGENNRFRNSVEDEESSLPLASEIPTKHIAVPDVVKQFVVYFHRHIKEKSVLDIQSMYENSFNKITEKHFKQSAWPSADLIAPIVNNDSIFLILYKEIYFRHIYAKMIPTIEQRFESWNNYCDFFNYLLGTKSAEIELPSQWLWDIIDEFIYQFQSFCQHRSKLKNRSKDEIILLQNNPQVWNVTTVINFLQSLINKSNSIPNNNENDTIVEEGLYKMLGYFSIIGLCRIHCLLGDYHLALETLSPIQFNAAKSLFTQVIGCHITLYYYMGFIYMMMRRYADAIRTFSSILLYISRTKHYHTRSYQFDQIQKKNEQMFGLLSICLSLSPQRVDENVQNMIRDKYSDKMLKMQKGDEATFEELFVYACPKFITPSLPNYNSLLEDNNNSNSQPAQQEALKLQTKLFLEEVKEQSLVPTIRSFLKLYTTIPLNKLSDFLETDQKSLRRELLCFKHKTRGLMWNNGIPLSGLLTNTNDIDFYLQKDMIHITDTKVQRKFSDFFVRHIQKFEEIISDVSTDSK